jgi:hypothetical protein
MYKLDSNKGKISKERDISEFTYESTLDWKFMKKLKSETKVRSWHIKVHLGKFNEKDKPIYEDFNISQVFIPKLGEQVSACRATKSGRPIDFNVNSLIFMKPSNDWLLGLEYLLKHLEGYDI